MRDSEAVFTVSRVRIALGSLALGGGLALLALFAAPQSASAADEPHSGGLLGALGGVVTSVTQPVVALVEPVVAPVTTSVVAPVVNQIVEPLVTPVVAPVVTEIVQPVAGAVDVVVDTAVQAVSPVTAAIPALKPVVNAIPKVTTTVQQLGGPKPAGTILTPIIAGVDGTIRELPIVGSIVGGVLGTTPVGSVTGPVVDVVDGAVGGVIGGAAGGAGGGTITVPIGTGPGLGGVLQPGSSGGVVLAGLPLGVDSVLGQSVASGAYPALALAFSVANTSTAAEYAEWAQTTGGETASLQASAPDSNGVPAPPRGPGESPGKQALPPPSSNSSTGSGATAHAASATGDLSPRSPDFTLQGTLVPRAGNEVLPSSPIFGTDSSPD